MAKFVLASSMSSFSSASTTANACFSIPLIAIVVFNKIAPTTMVTMMVRSSFPIIESSFRLSTINNTPTAVVEIITISTPPNFSRCAFSFLNNGTKLPMKFPIHAVG